MRTVILGDDSHLELLSYLNAERLRCEEVLRLAARNVARNWAGVPNETKRNTLERLPSVKTRLAQLVDWTDALTAAGPAALPVAAETRPDAESPLDPEAITEAGKSRVRFAAMADDEKVSMAKAMHEASDLLRRYVPLGQGTWPINPDDVLPAGVRIAVIDARAAHMHQHEDDAIGRFTTTEGMTVGVCSQIIQAVQTLSSVANGLGEGTVMPDMIRSAVDEVLAGHDVVLGVATVAPQVRPVKPMTVNVEIWGGTDTMLVQLVDDD